jgi:hypothetical protein
VLARVEARHDVEDRETLDAIRMVKCKAWALGEIDCILWIIFLAN